jgi:radical SAM protein with 4Fe4S-binding SPASM domain
MTPAQSEWPLPAEYWIELTSTCPFDCVFCSRKTVRGKGQAMNFATYQRLLSEIGHPRTIRLNYAGESMHYPHLIEAVRMAVATGAIVEMVTALASARADTLNELLETGIHDLCVSLHTLDEKRFAEIYRYGDLGKMLDRLHEISAFAKRRPEFHFEIAFVAMARNIDELPAIAALAERLGARRLVVHPVIRRDDIPEEFAAERVDGRLTESFRQQLRDQVDRAREAVTTLPVAISSPELETDLPAKPGAAFECAAPLPAGARIVNCHQSPFDTVHVLANGDVVTCEVRDQIPLGNLERESFREIWNGVSYRQFRKGFHAGINSHCRNCAYKIVALPGTVATPGPVAPKAGPTRWRQRLRLAPLTLGVQMRSAPILPHCPGVPARRVLRLRRGSQPIAPGFRYSSPNTTTSRSSPTRWAHSRARSARWMNPRTCWSSSTVRLLSVIANWPHVFRIVAGCFLSSRSDSAVPFAPA